MLMLWRYRRQGTHVHVDVFMGGASSGQLSFRANEFALLQRIFKDSSALIDFKDITPKDQNASEDSRKNTDYE